MPPTRRAVLRSGALAADGAALPLGYAGRPAAAAAPSRTDQAAEPAAWRELRRKLSPAARLYRPGHQDYASQATADNQRYADVRPAGILACATEDDVRTAVHWCAEHQVPFVPRSGGHNYAGHSTTPGLVLSLRPMHDVEPRGRRCRRPHPRRRPRLQRPQVGPDLRPAHRDPCRPRRRHPGTRHRG